jgi:hypothetical protein
MMDRPTNEAFEMVSQFTDDKDKQTVILVYLVEAPIGDEYGMLTKEEWALGGDYVEWLEARGTKAFEEYKWYAS